MIKKIKKNIYTRLSIINIYIYYISIKKRNKIKYYIFN